MNRSEDNQEAHKDIAAARADLLGRRDQAVADFDERLHLLDNIDKSLGAGTMEPRLAQTRVRQLIGERPAMARGTHAGRTRIGMQAPARVLPAAASVLSAHAAPSLGPSVTLAQAALTKVQQALDHRIVLVLAAAVDVASRRAARLELALLLQMRRSVDKQAQAVPQDAVLLQDLIYFTESADETLADLGFGGERRLARLLEFERQLASQLRAFGSPMNDVKKRIIEAQSLLKQGDKQLPLAMSTAVSAFEQLHAALERSWPTQAPALLDDILKLS